MADNDRVILDQLLTDSKAKHGASWKDDAFWEFYSASQILQNYSLDPDEIKAGIVGQAANPTLSGTDGGIDAIYLIVNGKMIRDTEQAKELSNHKGPIHFNIIIIQSTRSKGFQLTPLLRFRDTSEDIFSLHKDKSQFTETYNSLLLETIDCFRVAHRAILALNHVISVNFYVATSGDTETINSDMELKKKALEKNVEDMLNTIKKCTVSFIGSKEICDMALKNRTGPCPLKIVDHMTDGKGGHIVLVELSQFFNLIQENGQIKEHLFDSNVRDYEGHKDVNNEIRKTLDFPEKSIDFWWLNNGITIVADDVKGQRPELILVNPQIVNGLQSSQIIFESLTNPTLESKTFPTRHVLLISA